MDTNQPTTQPVYAPAAAAPGMFGTKIPSTVAFAIAVLLFFMPFVDIKCNGMKLQDVRGFELATGFKMKNSGSDVPYLDDVKTDGIDKAITKTTTKTDEKDPNLYAMIALGLGVIGLGLCFVKNKMAAGSGMVAGVLGAAALIGLMLDIKKEVKTNMLGGLADKTKDVTKGDVPELDTGLNKIGDQLSGLNISVDFTPWFYIAVIAFLAGVFFCYKRISSSK
jgi:hypothetical protein